MRAPSFPILDPVYQSVCLGLKYQRGVQNNPCSGCPQGKPLLGGGCSCDTSAVADMGWGDDGHADVLIKDWPFNVI